MIVSSDSIVKNWFTVSRKFVNYFLLAAVFIAAGGLLGVAWLGTSALASVLAALGMSYYLPGDPVGWESYTGAVWFSGSHIRFLQSAAGTGLISGVAIGMGLALRRLPALELLDA